MKHLALITLVLSCLVSTVLAAVPSADGDELVALYNTTNDIHCGSQEAMDELFLNHPQSLKEYTEFKNKKFSRPKNANSQSIQSDGGLAAVPAYVIPVVFHVYGTEFNGFSINDSIITDALQKTNEDIQGLTADYESIISEFTGVKDFLNVEFRLAKIGPNGGETTGIVYHSNQAGFSNSSGYDSAIQADAWDNYKYMNVYIQNDLYDDGTTNNSGTAWHPDSYMSNNHLARVVYNGAYLGSNTSENFRSVLTHEFGHWLDLYHPFLDGCSSVNEPLCSSTGDYICDTPQVDDSELQGNNCLGQMTNWQNFMHYSDQYANFTKLQVSNMVNAMNHPARSSLWTQTNLDATGTTTSFHINAGLNDAWYDPDTDGQGFFITVFPDLGVVSLAWFTYDTELPPEDAPANLGDAGHRWLTALGPIEGNQVPMNIDIASGGIFDTATDIQHTDPPGSGGTIILTFDHCNSGTVEYDITSINRQGIIPIRRVVDDNIVICEALNAD